MEKARIVNGKFAGLFSDKWLEENKEIIFSGQLVSEWELIEILPNENEQLYIDLSWDGINWFDSASLEQRKDKAELEIEILRDKTRIAISSLLYEHTQRKLMRDIPIPEEIENTYNSMREEYQLQKQSIYLKHNIEN